VFPTKVSCKYTRDLSGTNSSLQNQRFGPEKNCIHKCWHELLCDYINIHLDPFVAYPDRRQYICMIKRNKENRLFFKQFSPN